MKIMGYWSAAALGLALCSAGAQCRADEMVPSDHWDLSTFTQDGGAYTIAAIMATSKDSIINVICDPVGAYISIDPKRSLPKTVENRGLSLAFDGGAPIAQHWKSGTLTGGGIGRQDYFQVDQKDAEFQSVIDAFEQRREVDVSITDSGKEVQHQTFTLNGAPRAIDKVLAACKKPS